MVAHHDRVLEKQEIAAPPEFFNLCQRSRWSCRCSYGYELWELEFILLACVLTIFDSFTVNFAKERIS
jgi:hypothetical protein